MPVPRLVHAVTLYLDKVNTLEASYTVSTQSIIQGVFSETTEQAKYLQNTYFKLRTESKNTISARLKKTALAAANAAREFRKVNLLPQAAHFANIEQKLNAAANSIA